MECLKTRIWAPTRRKRRRGSGNRRHEYGCSLRRACCQANGLACASTMGWMRVEPQQQNAHPREDHGGSMNLPTSVAERVKIASGLNTRHAFAPLSRYRRTGSSATQRRGLIPRAPSLHARPAESVAVFHFIPSQSCRLNLTLACDTFPLLHGSLHKTSDGIVNVYSN